MDDDKPRGKSPRHTARLQEIINDIEEMRKDKEPEPVCSICGRAESAVPYLLIRSGRWVCPLHD